MKKIIFGSIIATIFFVVACEKEDSLPIRFTPVPGANTNVKFLQMSPDAPPINFLTNNIKISGVAPTTTNVVQGLAFGGFYPANVAYATVPSGSIKIDSKVPDSSTIRAGETILSNSQSLDPKKFYTYVLLDSLSRISSLLVEDDPSVPDATKAYFRVANFIANGPIKVEITKTSTGYPYSKNFPSLAAKTVTSFDSIGAALTYKVVMKHAVTDVRLDSIIAFTPTATKKYTLYARGAMGQTGSTNTRRPLIFNYINF